MSEPKDTKAEALSTHSIERREDLASGEIRDIAAELYAEADQLSPAELELEGVEVRKLLDWRILPIVSGSTILISHRRQLTGGISALCDLCHTIFG